MLKKIFTTGLRWLWIAVIIVLVDHVTKYLVQQHLTPYVAKPIFPSFNLMLAYNRGAAFSFLDTGHQWQVWFLGGLAVVISVGILIWLSRLDAKQRWLSIAFSLIIGGALGNLWDRVALGHVVDFIQFYVAYWYWPAFNVADSAICVGAVMLFWDALFHQKKK